MQSLLLNGQQKFWKIFSFGVSPFQALLPVVTSSQACHLSTDFLLPQCLCIIKYFFQFELQKSQFAGLRSQIRKLPQKYLQKH